MCSSRTVRIVEAMSLHLRDDLPRSIRDGARSGGSGTHLCALRTRDACTP
jgi:hypothetical protein